jgi:DNA-binding NarL/FixJ family response regulator
MEDSKITIIVADDHELFRNGLVLFLSAVKTFEIVGTARNGSELISIAHEAQADVILTDISMPKVDGIEATREIVKNNENVGVIALTMFSDEEAIINMMKAGARGFLQKSCDLAEIKEAINAIYDKHNYFCKATTEKLSKLYRKNEFIGEFKKDVSLLSDREIEIIRLICEEFSAKEIGERLNCSFRTIEGCRVKILEKINAKNVAGIVLFAIKNRLFPRQIDDRYNF